MRLIQAMLRLARPFVERFPGLAQSYRLVRDELASRRSLRMTPHGFLFAGTPGMEQGVYEPLETRAVQSCLGDADVLVNVGANIGYYCCIAASMGKQVIAFEPIQQNLRLLYQNLWANGWQDVEVLPLALSAKPGLLEIYGAGTGASLIKGWANTSESFRQVVPVSTLDLVLGERLQGHRCLFLIDVEGAEYQVLLGAVNQLAMEPRPTWIVEITTTEHQPASTPVNPHLVDTFDLFWQHNYTARAVNDRNEDVTPEDVQRMTQSGENLFGTHSFIFT